MTPVCIPVALLTGEAIHGLCCVCIDKMEHTNDSAVLEDWLTENGVSIRTLCKTQTLYNLQQFSVAGDWGNRLINYGDHKYFGLMLQLLKPWLPPVPIPYPPRG